MNSTKGLMVRGYYTISHRDLPVNCEGTRLEQVVGFACERMSGYDSARTWGDQRRWRSRGVRLQGSARKEASRCPTARHAGHGGGRFWEILGSRELCRGYPVGDLGYHLRCGAPAGVHLFRVVDAAGKSSLAVRYNERLLIRVGR